MALRSPPAQESPRSGEARPSGPPPVVRFCLVGMLGFAVQCAAAVTLTHGGLPYPAATACATGAAIVHNFFWHDRWTWRNRAARSPVDRGARFVRFSGAAAAISIVGNVAGAVLFVELLHAPLVVANLLAVLCCSALTFAAADSFVFTVRAGA